MFGYSNAYTKVHFQSECTTAALPNAVETISNRIKVIYSTTNAQVIVSKTITCALVGDLRNAFDFVPHTLLVHKLRACGSSDA